MNIEEIVNKINNKEATREEIGESIGISGSTLTRYIRDAGYKYDQKTKLYSLASSNPEAQKEIKIGSRQYRKKENKPSNKQEKEETNNPTIQEKRIIKKVTYEINEDLHYELRMEAFKQKKNVSILVEAAIREYLRDRR